MEKSEAKKILSKSISNLHSRRGQLTNSDIESEVINNACLTFLKRQREIISEEGSLEDFISKIIDSTTDIVPISKAFTDAASELFPDFYSSKQAIAAMMGIQQNVTWEGMWDYLRDYFESNHGISIDDVETHTLVFYSNKHIRYENGEIVSESEVERTIKINFIEEKDVIISIAPSLSPKKAYLIENDNNYKKYKGYDPDYLFTAEFDEFEEVTKFIMMLPNRNLRIEYFE